jgi:hypothetical protein
MRIQDALAALRDSAAHPPQLARARTRDAMTFDRRTIDSTGAFLEGELERLDQTLHEPLVAVTWTRDIDLREDVTIADEASSFTNSTFASAGGINPTGIAWIGKNSDAVTGIALDIGKTANPLNLWGQEIKYSIPELESAMKLGRPVDQQKYAGMQLKHQMDVDQLVYTGDSSIGTVGLCNSSAVTVGNVAVGGSGSTQWSTKTPDEILYDVNVLLESTWAAAGYAVMPGRLLLPPVQFSYIVSQKVSTAGNVSILEFLRANSLTNATLGTPLDVQPLKWLTGGGAGGTLGNASTTNRMVAYTKDINRVRYPMTLMSKTPLEYRSIYHVTTYFCRLGVVEFVYPETVQYADGI